MNQHAAVNRIYRLVWSEAARAWVAVAETSRQRGTCPGGARLAAVFASLWAAAAHAGPTSGQVTAGTGTITQSGSTTTVNQATQNLSLNWQTFNVAPQETVNFVQPNSAAVAVNRILDSNGSVILGHLDANGQVYLINPNGVLFGRSAEVNVGGLVASTLSLNGGISQTESFSGSGSGAVVNEGAITTSTGGSVALLGNYVRNTGTISARLGTVALGAGSAATLAFSDTHLVAMQIDQSVLNSEASNGGLIRADGGQVVMTAGAQRALLASVVNNTGVIEARTLQNHEGTIILLGGMNAGALNDSGTLDASAPDGGNGGSIETSAAHVEIAKSARITTAAAMGLNGTWTIDPDGFTIAPSGGDMTGAALTAALASGNVAIASTSGNGSDGNVNVDDAVSWSANKLALTATNDVNVNAVMTATGSASLDLAPGSNNVNVGMNADGTFRGRIDFSGTGVLRMNVAGTLQTFTVINSLGSQGDETSAANTLQGMAATSNLSGFFALGSDIDATETSGWNSGAGFTTIGNGTNFFAGTFDGLGHTISNPTINQPGNDSIGLFGFVTFGGEVRNVGIIGGTVSGHNFVGELVGFAYGVIRNSYATGDVVGEASSQYVGGLVGDIYGDVINSHASGSVTAGASSTYVGGLAGNVNGGTVSDSYATGAVSGGSYVGGLVGNTSGTINNSYATGAVSGSNYVGGLAGYTSGDVISSFASGDVSGDSSIGGLVGYAYYGSAISQSHSTSNVMGSSYVGGLVGFTQGSIATSNATGMVTGSGNDVGGLVGKSASESSITTSFATGAVTGATYTGGLVGLTKESISDSYALGSVSGARYSGGLAGFTYGEVTHSFASGNVSGTTDVGGLAGGAWSSGNINESYATGSATGTDAVGGLLGSNHAGTLSNDYSTGAVHAIGATHIGGLIGLNSGTVSNSFYSTSANTDLTGMSDSSGPMADVAGTVWGMNTASLNTQENFTSATSANGNMNPAWDFTNTWYQYEGNTAPLLQVFMTPVTVSAAITQTYNGGAFAPTINGLSYSIANPDLSQIFGTVTVGGTAVGARHAGSYTFTPGGLYSDQLGYMLNYSAGSLVITPEPLTVTGTTATKVYDGTTAAPLTGGSLVGVASGDVVTLTQAGSFASRNVGTGISIDVADSIGGPDIGDYTLVQPTVTGTITPATLTVNGTSVGTKVYDGTTAATLTGGSLVGVVNGDVVTLTQAGSFASRNVGTGIPVNVADSVGGPDVADYTLVQPTVTGTITPATLTVNGTSVGTKVYDGTTAATLTGGMLIGVISGDAVSLSQSGTFASANIGTDIAVTATDSLIGANASNYSIVEPSGLTGSIVPASGSSGSSITAPAPVAAAINTRTQIEQNLLYPQLGAVPQEIDASSTIQTSQQATTVNVSMKIGATGTLSIESGGLRLPDNLVIGNE